MSIQLTDSQMARNWLSQQRVLKKKIFWRKSSGYMLKAADYSLKRTWEDWTG